MFGFFNIFNFIFVKFQLLNFYEIGQIIMSIEETAGKKQRSKMRPCGPFKGISIP